MDEEKNHVLTRITKAINRVITKEMDHNVLISKFDFQWNRKIKQKLIEMYNLKNEDCRKKFTEYTNNVSAFWNFWLYWWRSKKSTEKFLKRLDNIIKKCFKKVRIKEKNNKHEEQLFKQRNILKNKTDANSKNKLFDINKI